MKLCSLLALLLCVSCVETKQGTFSPQCPRASSTYGHSCRAPKDEIFTSQRALKTIGAPEAWRLISQEGSTNVITAVIDNGVDLNHPDLVNQLESGVDIPCMSIECDGGKPTGIHGTAMAGIIAAARNNGGIVGTAWNTRVLPIKISADEPNKFESNTIAAFQFAVNRGARVINFSYTSNEPTDALARVLRNSPADFLFVVPAGNEGVGSSGNATYPASYSIDRMIVVMSDDTDGGQSRQRGSGTRIDIAAPAEAIYPIPCDPPKNTKCYQSGASSSNSTAFVSGAAALLWSIYPEWKAEHIRWRLLENGLREEELGGSLGPPRRLNLERMMFPVRFNAATDLRQIHAAKLQSIELKKKPLPKQLDISTSFPEGMCETVELALLRTNRPSREFLTPKKAKKGDTVQFLATCHRARETHYTARSVSYEIID